MRVAVALGLSSRRRIIVAWGKTSRRAQARPNHSKGSYRRVQRLSVSLGTGSRKARCDESKTSTHEGEIRLGTRLPLPQHKYARYAAILAAARIGLVS